MTDDKKKLAIKYMAKAKAAANETIEKIDTILTTTQHQQWFSGLRKMTQEVNNDLATFLASAEKGADFSEKTIFTIHQKNNATLFNINMVAQTPEQIKGRNVDDMTDQELRSSRISRETISNIRLRVALEGIRDAINDALLVLTGHEPNYHIEEQHQRT